jgi:Replication-relaxation
MTDVPIGVPFDVPIGVPIAVREHKRNPLSDGTSPSGRTPRPSRPPRPSPRDQLIIQTVQRFNQVSSDQLTRLYYADHSPDWRRRRCNRATSRLLEWGELACIPSAIGGFRGGSTGCIYIPATSRARTPDAHTLDIAELYVRLVEQQRLGQYQVLAFDPEPFSYDQVGSVELKPDAMVRTKTPRGRLRWYLEVDRGTEWRARLNQKMRLYVSAYRRWPDRTFPRVLFIVPDEQRARFVEGVTKRQEIPQLFTVCTFDDALSMLTA